jgi:monoamine oxidase
VHLILIILLIHFFGVFHEMLRSLHAFAQFARVASSIAISTCISTCLLLQQMYPDRVVPEPIDVYIPRWHSDPYFMGSYSNMKVGSSNNDLYFKGKLLTALSFA